VTNVVSRERNRRGEGSKLRTEILDAATTLLEETGTEQAITLRAIARGIGISAPSIYAHFPDRDAIVSAIVDDGFRELSATIQRAVDLETDAVRQLRAGCAAYLSFAAERPHRYRVVFECSDVVDADLSKPLPQVRADAFGLLVAAVQRCVDAGASASTDPFGDAVAIWVALHGYATLRPALPAFPWPAGDSTLDRIVYGIAGVTR
jgi:AcrR family transcriptional regulator